MVELKNVCFTYTGERTVDELVLSQLLGRSIFELSGGGKHQELARQEGLYRSFIKTREQAEGWKIG